MIEAFLSAVTGLLGSPWGPPLLFAFATLDAFLPVVPSETMVVAASALSLGGHGPSLLLVWFLAAAGAVLGDRISYAIGARVGPRLLAGPVGGRRARVLRATQRQLAQRGAALIVSARFVPGGRTTVTMACGATGYPSRKFLTTTAVSGALWASSCVLLGYFGTVLGGDVHGSVLWGVLLAFTLAGAGELARWMRHRTRRRPAEPVGKTVGRTSGNRQEDRVR